MPSQGRDVQPGICSPLWLTPWLLYSELMPHHEQIPARCPPGSGFDCCYVCAPGRVLWPSCFSLCVDVEQAYLLGAKVSAALFGSPPPPSDPLTPPPRPQAGCQQCPVGQIQNATSGTTCAPCSAFPQYGPNFQTTTYGCAECAPLSVVAAGGASCEPCRAGEYVRRGTAVCVGCASGSVLSVVRGACVACDPGICSFPKSYSSIAC